MTRFRIKEEKRVYQNGDVKTTYTLQKRQLSIFFSSRAYWEWWIDVKADVAEWYNGECFVYSRKMQSEHLEPIKSVQRNIKSLGKGTYLGTAYQRVFTQTDIFGDKRPESRYDVINVVEFKTYMGLPVYKDFRTENDLKAYIHTLNPIRTEVKYI